MEPGDEMNQPAPGEQRDADTTGMAGDELGPDTTADEAGGRGDQAARARETADHWLHQLQEMIDGAAHVAGPVLREVAAKAAELTAVAAEHAGPVAHRAADATQRAGEKVAARSKSLAGDLRHAAEAERAAHSSSTGTDGEPPAEAMEDNVLGLQDLAGSPDTEAAEPETKDAPQS